MHVSVDTAVNVEYFPAIQLTQPSPVLVLYVPVGHSLHIIPLVSLLPEPVQPALQLHAVDATLPPGALAFALQALQFGCPTASWKELAGQLVQALAPAFEYVPAAQLEQVSSFHCAVTADFLPAAQFVHVI